MPDIQTSDETNEQTFSSSIVYLQEQDADTPMAESLESLPPIVGRGLLYLLVLILVTGISYAGFCKIDIIRETRSTVVPEGKSKSIQSEVDGVITQIRVREGEEVDEGQVLAVMESPEVGQLLADLKTAEESLEAAQHEFEKVIPLKVSLIESQKKLLQLKRESLQRTMAVLEQKLQSEQKAFDLAGQIESVQKQKYVEQLKRLEVESQNTKSTFELWMQELAANQRLRERGIVSDLEFLSTLRSHDMAKGAVEKSLSLIREAQKESELVELQSQADKLEHERKVSDVEVSISQSNDTQLDLDVQINQRDREITLLRIDAEKALKQSLLNYERSRRAVELNMQGVSSHLLEQLVDQETAVTDKAVIRAPKAGRIASISVTVGEVATRGRTLMMLLPEDAAMQMELRITNDTIGKMQTGLPVKLKFDAFPYAEYGAIYGELTRIIPEAENTTSAQGQPESSYRAYVSLSQDYFLEKGEKKLLLPGMTANAEIVTERQSILSLLLKPFMELQPDRRAVQSQADEAS